MRIEVSGTVGEEGNELETFTFAFHPSTFGITLVDAKRFVRSDEYAPWRETSHWFYPDLQDKSTMAEPEIPDWAIVQARYFISEKIHVQP